MEVEQILNLFDQLDDALLVIGKDSIVEYANNAACILFKRTKAYLTSIDCSAIYESGEDYYSATLTNQKTGKTLIRQVLTKDNQPIEIINTVLKTIDGIKVAQIIHPGSTQIETKPDAQSLFPTAIKENIQFINYLALPAIITSKNGTIYYANPSWEDITGYRRESILNTDINTLLIKHLGQNKYDNVAFSKEFKDYDNETFIINNKNGQGGIFSVHISTFINENETFYIWLFMRVSYEEDSREEIQQSEEYLKSIFRAAPIGIGVTINRIFYFVNLRICEITGFSSGELLGKSTILLYPDEKEYKRVGKLKYDQIEKKGIGAIETVWKCKDGTLKEILLSSTPIEPDNPSKGVTFTALDITRRKEAERKFRASEKKYRNLIKTAADAIFVADAKTGKIIEANEKACELIGRAEKEIIGMHQSELHPKDRAREIANEFNEVTKHKRTIAQTEVLHKSGKRIPVEINPSIYTNEQGRKLIIGFFRDLTSRFVWQRALQESELRFKVLFETAKEGIALANQKTKKFEYVNPAMCDFLGFPKEELLQKRTDDIHEKKDFPEIQAKIQRALRGELQSAIDIPCLTKAGKKVYADIQATYIFLEGVKYTAAFFNNITKRREIEKKLRTINRELQISRKNYRRLFTEMVSGFAVHRMVYNEKEEPIDYRFLEVNPAFEKFTGLKTDQIINKTIKELMPDIEVSWIERYAEVAKTGKPIVFQQYAGPLNRHYEVTAYSPEKDLFATIFTDVTSLVEATKKLEQSEERYRELVENSPNILLVIRNQKLLYANPSALKFLGYKNFDELKEHDPFSFVHPDYIQIVKKRLKDLKHGVRNEAIQLKLLSKNGKERIIDSRSLAINYGNKPAALVMGVDITQKVRIEKVAMKTQSAIENIQKGIASKVGEKFFETIVTHLARTLKADFSFVGELGHDNPLFIETISVIENGIIIPNFEYELKDTPCQDVLERGMCCVNHNVTTLFPKDQMLIDMGIQGYVGVPLSNSKGNSVGIIVVLFKNPIEDPEFAKTILEIFSIRAGAEIERRISEKELERANELFKTITQNIPDIILRVDRYFRCTYVSPHVHQMAGISAEEFIGKRISEFDLRTDFTENREKEFEQVLLSKSSYQTVLNVVTAQNRRVLEWRMVPEFDENGEVLSILNIIRDITEMRKTEIELNQIFNLSADLICIINTKGRFLKVNPAFENILGHSEQEILAARIFDLIHPDDVESTKTIFRGKISKSERVISFENRILCKDATYKWISWVAQRLVDEKMVYAIARDITAQRESIKELVQAKEKAEESDRLKSTFLANMSHEIRTPMNAIMGFAMLLQRRSLKPEKIEHYTNIIKHRSEDLLNIINDILDISKIELGQLSIIKEEFLINDVFNEIYDEFSEKLKSKSEKSIAFKIEDYAQGEYQKVINDILRIKQVLTNLIDNAIKFTTTGYVKFGCKPLDKEIKFYVTDTGIGISMHKQKNVFEPFRQVDDSITREFGGNGLGLAISKALVELMGGKIWLESKESVGTTFFFTIPHVVVNVDAAAVTEKSGHEDFNLSGKRILVVEDDPLSIEFFRIVLEDAKAEVVVAGSGGEALIIYETDPVFDLILMDVQLPDINGYEVTKRIRKTNGKIPIIAQTAFAMAEDRTKSLKAGCNEYLSKPILSGELLEVVYNQIKQATSH